MMRIFLDVNVLILSTWTMAECREVSARKFPAKRESLEAFFASLEFERFETPASIDPASYPPIRDPRDLPVLASAIMSDADVLMTGDRDLLEIEGPPKRPLIFSPGDYAKLI